MRMLTLVTVAGLLIAAPIHAQTPQQTPQAPAPAPKNASPAPSAPPAAPKAATPAPQPAGAQAAAAPKPAQSAEKPAEVYTYHAEGRRDPFQSLVGTGSTAAATSRKGEGPAGLAVGEISVHGVMQSRGSLVAMIMGPDKKTYIVHQGDKLLDGTIKAITPQGLVVVQEVNDPLSLVKQREIRKLLRSLEDAKE